MDRALDEIVAERHRPSNRGRRPPPTGPSQPRRNNYPSYPRDGVRKPVREERANLDNDWVHDRYDDDPSMSRGSQGRPRGRRDDFEDRYDEDRDRDRDRERAPPPPAKIRVENLHYDLTEDDIFELFTRIAPVVDVKMRYDRAGRSDGVAVVTYDHLPDARKAIHEFDGANAKGQPIRLSLMPLPRRENPFDRVENPRSLFDRIEAPGGRSRRRSDSPRSDAEEERERGYRSAPRRGGGPPARDRRSDTTKPPPENIDRYVPGQRNGGGRSSSHRGGGRRPGERRERVPRTDDTGHKMVGGRPRKTQEELDAEMDDYWGGGQAEAGGVAQQTAVAAAGATVKTTADDDIDMIE